MQRDKNVGDIRPSNKSPEFRSESPDAPRPWDENDQTNTYKQTVEAENQERLVVKNSASKSENAELNANDEPEETTMTDDDPNQGTTSDLTSARTNSLIHEDKKAPGFIRKLMPWKRDTKKDQVIH